MYLHFKCYSISPLSIPLPPSSCFYEDVPSPTLPLPPQCPGIPLHWRNEPSQDQGLLLMPDNAILCYICGWSHGSLNMYSLVGGLVPGSLGRGGLVDWYCCSYYGVANPFSSFSPFSNSSTGVPMLQAFSSVSVRLWLSLSGDIHIRFLSASTFGISNSIWVWWLHMGWIPRWGSLWMTFSSVPAPLFVPVFLPMRILFSLIQRRIWNIHILVFLLLELCIVFELFFGYSELLG